MQKAIFLATVIAAAALLALYHPSQTEVSLFDEWKAKYQYEFALGEETYRRVIFEKNIREMELHNQDSTKTYKMGINQFSIFTQEEFAERFLMKTGVSAMVSENAVASVGVDIDWVAKGMVSPIKNQGQCGSCWSFSATGVSESWSLMKGSRVSLSEQQLVDCSASYGNQGCNGGWPVAALKYVRDHGLSTESEYPYTARTGSCQKTGGNFKIGTIVSAKGCTDLQNALMKNPVSVTVDANKWSSYSSGVFNNCGSQIDHAVLLVGSSSSFWKIKNSWGTSWGESGYIRLAMGNTCAVCQLDSPYIQ